MMNVLLPTDFSENSKNAITYAMEYFSGMSCTFFFLNIQRSGEMTMDDFYSASNSDSVEKALLDDNLKDLQAFSGRIKKQFPSHNFAFKEKVAFGTFASVVSRAVNRFNIDIIAMGSNGATGAKEVLFGSNTLQIIRELPCTMLIIPEQHSYQPVSSVLFSMHSEERLQHEKLTTLVAILERTQAHLHVVEVASNEAEAFHEAAVKDVLPREQLSFHFLNKLPYPMAVDAFTQLFTPNMHCLFIPKESFMDRWLYGSEAQQLQYGSRIPLLILGYTK